MFRPVLDDKKFFKKVVCYKHLLRSQQWDCRMDKPFSSVPLMMIAAKVQSGTPNDGDQYEWATACRFHHRNIAHNTAGDIDSGYEDVEGVLY